MKTYPSFGSTLTAIGLAAALITLAGPQGSAFAQGNAPANGASAKPHPAKPPFPQLSLPERKSHGQVAIDLLGSRLPEVAAWYGKSPDEFRSLLLNDRRMKIDQRGRLFVEDELDAPLPVTPASSTRPQSGATPASAASVSISGALAPLDQTFLLHSRPGAARTIYLNFKGALLSSTAWNGSTPTLTALPFDTDGLPNVFSQGELERIQYIWQRVVEDFAPFDVDVTTEPPPADRLTRSGSTDQVFGTTVLITSKNGVYSCSCGGVAYVGIFDDTSDYYKPALVFYDALGSGNEKYVAEAVSHEAGHNMGLSHDGTSSTGYYQGQGTGATGWAPIMGVGYYKDLVQWSKGEYASANMVQDDYGVMGTNGLPLRTDDHGNTSGTASPLSGSSSGGITTLATEGVIERPSDVDVFSFSSGAGTISFNLAPAARSSNLDALIELRNSAGTLLASANPLDTLPAALSLTNASAGTYYLSVLGVGKGDPLTTGYTDYGSLGQYALTGSVPTSANQPPVAVATATPSSGTVPFTANFASTGSYDPENSTLSYEWNFGDGSALATGASASHPYSTAGTYSATLKVTDNSGLTATRSVDINAQNPVVLMTLRVADIAMSKTYNTKTRNAQATAAVKVTDITTGQVLPGATVTGTWSGLVSGNVSGVTGSNGIASLASPNTKKTSGTFIFTVTGITRPGYSYVSDENVKTSASIAR